MPFRAAGLLLRGECMVDTEFHFKQLLKAVAIERAVFGANRETCKVLPAQLQSFPAQASRLGPVAGLSERQQFPATGQQTLPAAIKSLSMCRAFFLW